MLIPALTFFGVLAIVIGIYWIVIVVPESRGHASVRRRLKSERATKAALRLERDPEKLSNIVALDSVLNRVENLSGPLKQWIDQSDLNLNVGTFLLLSGVCFFAVMLGVNLYFRRWWWLGASGGVVAAFIPLIVVRVMRSRRILQFEEQFPEAIELIARSMRAGHAFTTGLKMAADELPPPASAEFKLLYDRQNYGAEIPEALKAFADRIPSLDARFFVTAVLTQRETGGNLSEVLDRLAAVMRERFRIKREVRVRSTHGRITAFVLAGMPPGIAVMLLIINPKQMEILVTDPLGIRMIIVGAVLQVIGTLVVRKLVDIKY